MLFSIMEINSEEEGRLLKSSCQHALIISTNSFGQSDGIVGLSFYNLFSLQK